MLLFYKTTTYVKGLSRLHTLHYKEGLISNSIYISSNNAVRVKFVVLATSAKILSMYLLPMLFILRLVRFFLLYFRYLTLYSTYILGKELKYITKKKNTCTLLGPLKPFKIPVNLLIRFRIPFVFVGYTTTKDWALLKYRYLNLVFGFYKIQRIYRVQNLLPH
jgi:hypothetical protein